MANQGGYHHVANDHTSRLLRHLNKLRISREFCDIQICVHNKVFPADRNVLAASSPYFEAMFTGGLAEMKKDQVHIHGISPHIFGILLDFIYSGEIEVTSEVCQDLVGGADMLGLEAVVHACCTFMKLQLAADNCLGMWLFADVHGCVDLRDTIESYIHNNFLAVTKEEEYMELSKDKLITLLHSENLHVDNEFQVFTAAMSWILHHVTSRRKFIFEILAPIRFPIISQKQLEKYIEDCEDLSLKIALRKLAQDFFRRDKLSHLNLTIGRLKPYLLQPRKCARKSIYVIGGYCREVGGRWSDSTSLASVDSFNSFNQTWTKGLPMRRARSSHSAVALNGTIYVMGGESDSLIYDNVESFDPSCSKWSIGPSLTVARCGLGACVMDGCIYAIGGWVGSNIGDTIEKFDPEVGHWKVIGKVQTLRFAMGITACNGLLYLIGGINDLGSQMRDVESYNPVTGEWTELCPMKCDRAYMGIAVQDNHIYAIGGWNEYREALDVVEKYSIKENRWSDVIAMSQARAGAGVAAINGLIYVMGGRTSSMSEFSAPSTLDTVECYDHQTDSWFDIAPLPSGRCEMAVVVL